MVKKYDIRSTLIYAIGRAIEEEDDPVVREQLEDLEEKVTNAWRNVDNARVLEILTR